MLETIQIVLLGGGSLFLLAIVVLILKSMWEAAVDRRQLKAQFDNENFHAFGRIPESSAALHRCPHALKDEMDFEIIPPTGKTLRVSHFKPLQAQSLAFVRSCWMDRFIPVAANSSGQYCILREPFEEDPAVYFLDYELGPEVIVAPSLKEFLSWPRKYKHRKKSRS